MSQSANELRDNQIFIRNLAFSTTKEDLINFFQTIGPVKHASLAMDSNGASRGFGFVTFSIPSDAEEAVKKLHGQTVAGRAIKLELSIKKPTEKYSKKKKDNNSASAISENSSQEEQSKTQESKEMIVESKETPVESVEADSKVASQGTTESSTAAAAAVDPSLPNRRLQILATGIPSNVNKGDFRKVLSKISRKSEVELVKEDHPLLSQISSIIYPSGRVMIITCPSRPEMVKVVNGMDGKTVKSLGFTVDKKENDASEEAQSGKQHLCLRVLTDIATEESGLRKKKCRVIIRNLSFQANEMNVASKMGKFGPLVEVTLPRVAVPVKENSGFHRRRQSEQEAEQEKMKPRGFAFVTYLCAKDAQAAVEACSSMSSGTASAASSSAASIKICNREVSIDFCANKHSWEKDQERSKDVSQEDEDQEEKDGSQEDVKKTGGDDDDVDDEKDPMNEEEGEKEDEEDEEAMDVDEEENEEEEEENEEEDDDENEEEADDMEDTDEKPSKKKSDNSVDGKEGVEEVAEAEEEEEEEMKKIYDDVGHGCTLFVRELAFDAKPGDLIRSFKQFGRIALAILVKDKNTGLSRGTAFVKFEKADSATKALEYAQSNEIIVKNRACRIDLAVDREKATLLKSSGASELRKHGHRDKRNLYLANEGLTIELTGDINPLEKARLERAQADKKKKLQNPLFFVSPVRLSLRNLPKDMSEKDLKYMCIRAAKSGMDKGLVQKADMLAQLIAQDVPPIERSPDRLALHPISQSKKDMSSEAMSVLSSSVVKNAVVMLDNTKIRDGKARSKGFGFVEFRHHDHALACLRELTASKSKAGNNKESILVDFSVENIRKVRLLEERKRKSQTVGISSYSELDEDMQKNVAKTSKKEETNKKRKPREDGKERRSFKKSRK